MNTHKIISSAVILIVAILTYLIVGRIMRRIIKSSTYSGKQTDEQLADAKKREATLVKLFNMLWKTFIIAITGAILLKNIFPNVNLSPLFASAGIVSVAIAFGSQSIVKDLMTGIFIISENQFRVGDTVEINNAIGTVEQIGIRSTVIRDLDGNVHYLPNGTIQHVTNKTMGYSVARFSLKVAPSTDIKLLKSIVDTVGEKIASSEKWKSKVLEPPRFTSIEDITGASITVIISGKTKPSEQWSVTAEIRRRLLLELEKAKINLAK